MRGTHKLSVRKSIRRSAALLEALESRRLFSAFIPDLAIRTPATNAMAADTNGDGVADKTWSLPVGTLSTDTVLAADFNGDTVTDLAAYRNGTWRLDYSSDGTLDATYVFGAAGKLAVAGDVNGDGKADLGTYNPGNGVWKFDTNHDGNSEVSFTFTGAANSIPLMGDFNGDGKADAVLYTGGVWTVDLGCRTVTAPDKTYLFGSSAFTPVVADFNGDGSADIAACAAGYVYANTDLAGGPEMTLHLGTGAEQPLPGYYNTSSSIFVSPTGSDSNSGLLGSPLATVAKAITLSSSRYSNIRLAAGTYAQNVYLYSKSYVNLIGAGMNATVIAPASGDGIFLDHDNGINVSNLASSPANGRGFVVYGSNVTLAEVKTTGSKQEGVLVANASPSISSISVNACKFDGSLSGRGLWLQSDGMGASIKNCTFNNNATEGLFTSDTVAMAITNCEFAGNGTDGLLANQARLNFSDLSFHNNTGRGLVLMGAGAPMTLWHVYAHDNGASNLLATAASGTNPNLSIGSCQFDNSTGSNGIWFADHVTASIDSSTLNGNHGNGLMAESSSTVTVTRCDLSGNGGDGLIASQAGLTLADLTVHNNTGRGVVIMGALAPMTLLHVYCHDNVSNNLLATAASGTNPNLTINSCQFDNSTSAMGVWLADHVTANIIASTMIGNHTNGVMAENGSTVTVSGSYISENLGDGTVVRLASMTLLTNYIGTNRGRGSVVLGATLFSDANNISANYLSNILANSYNATNSTLTVQNTLANRSEIKYGLWLQDGVTAQVTNCQFNRNGMTPAEIPGSTNFDGGDGGYGIVADGASIATINVSYIKRNFNMGVAVVGSANVTLNNNVISESGKGGIITSQTPTLTIRGNVIQLTGTIRSTADGFNGIEFMDVPGFRFAGHAVVDGNTIINNTAFGVLVAAGTDIVISNNYFNGQPVGIGFEGTETAASATVIGNSIVTPSAALHDTGIWLLGSAASATIGGSTAAAKNTFWGFDASYSIFGARVGHTPPQDFGIPTMASDLQLVADNIFQACVAPYVGHDY